MSTRSLLPLKMPNLFVYGTLMDEDVVRSAMGRLPEAKPAVLRGYRRYKLRNRLYPGVQKSAEADEVNGHIFSLSNEEIVALDNYEGSEYTRDLVQVLINGQDKTDSFIYLWKDSLSQDGNGDSPDWAHLPGSVQVALVAQMEKRNQYKALHAMLGVCRMWNGSVTSNLKYLRLNFNLDLGEVGMTFRSVETLDLSHMTVGGSLQGISKFGALQSLYLNGSLRRKFQTNIDDIIVQELVNVRSLTCLDGLVFRGLVPVQSRGMTGLRNLSLHAFNASTNPLGFKHLTALELLESLSLTHCHFGLTPMSLEMHTNLRTLKLVSCGTISSRYILPPPRLQEIDVRRTSIELNFLDHLEYLTKVVCSSEIYYGVASIPQVPNLVHLGLYDAFEFRKEDVHVHMYNLVRLDVLEATGLLQSGILNHFEFPLLKRLSVCATGVQDDCFENLTMLTDLSSLVVNVKGHALSRYGAMCLMELTGLTQMLFYPSVEPIDEDCIRRLYNSFPLLVSVTLDYDEVIGEGKALLRAKSRELPVFLGSGCMANSRSLDETKIGGAALVLATEPDKLCAHCNSKLILLFQLDYGSIPQPLKALFSDSLLQLLVCPACPTSGELRLIPRAVRDLYGCKSFGEEHILPWVGSNVGIHPTTINTWKKWSNFFVPASSRVVKDVLDELSIDEPLWKNERLQHPPSNDLVIRVGGRINYLPLEDVPCLICQSQMDMVAASVRIPNSVGECTFLPQETGGVVTILCCPFHTDQMCLRIVHPLHHGLLRCEIVQMN